MLFLGLSRHLVVNRKLRLNKRKATQSGWVFDGPSRAKSMLTDQIYLQASHLEIIDGDVSKRAMGGRDHGLGIGRARPDKWEILHKALCKFSQLFTFFLSSVKQNKYKNGLFILCLFCFL